MRVDKNKWLDTVNTYKARPQKLKLKLGKQQPT